MASLNPATPARVESAAGAVPVKPYEQRLSEDFRWALSEGGKHFRGTSEVEQAMFRIANRLDELGIPYAVAGAMALFAHGLRRFTEDVDILVSREGLQRIHQELEGLGWVRLFSNSKNLRDVSAGVRIEFLIAGQYPGDGKPKPVAFPDPADVAVELDGIKLVNLPTLVQLKLASGISGLDRLKDLADVQEVIKVLDLPKEFGEQLDASVRGKFAELWSAVQAARSAQREGYLD